MKAITLRLGAAVIAIALLGASSGNVEAEVITFDLRGVTFDDGGTASGSIVYDTAAQQATYDVTTTAGSVLGPQTYAGSYTADGSTYDSTLPVCDGCVEPGDLRFDVIRWLSPLPPFHTRGLDISVPDTAPLDTPIAIDLGWFSFEFECFGQGCSSGYAERRITGGYLVPTNYIPEPSSALLLGFALAAILGVARGARRHRALMTRG